MLFYKSEIFSYISGASLPFSEGARGSLLFTGRQNFSKN